MTTDQLIRAQVQQDIHAHGVSVTVQHYDLSTDKALPEPLLAAETSVTAIVEDFSAVERARPAVGAFRCDPADRKVTIAGADLDRHVSELDRVIVDGIAYYVLWIWREMAQYQPARYVLQLRA